MKEAIRPLDLVVPDQFFDATKRRVSSFFGDGIVAHVGMAEPVCPDLAGALEKAARQTSATVHRGGTYICIEGPQFSTRAESRIYRSWGVDIIGMTNMPEAKLAREAELCYATLALATDYDVWHETHEAVSVEAVVQNLLKNVATAKDVLRRVIPAIAPPRGCECPSLLKNAVDHQPQSAFPAATRKKLDSYSTRTFRANGTGVGGCTHSRPPSVKGGLTVPATMSDLLVVGSVALDSVETPFGKVQEALGGSATYFSYSASFFTAVHLVATVGEDFPEAHLKLLADRGVDIRGLQTSKGRTFRWTGQYGYDLNEAKTLETQLNVFAEFRPVLNDVSGRTPFLFLANIDPELQLDVLRQMKERPKLVALDTMNFWIQGKREALRKVLAEVDVVTVNDGEARQLASEPNLIQRGAGHLGDGTEDRRRQARRVRRAAQHRGPALLRAGLSAGIGLRPDRRRRHVRGRIHGLPRRLRTGSTPPRCGARSSTAR